MKPILFTLQTALLLSVLFPLNSVAEVSADAINLGSATVAVGETKKLTPSNNDYKTFLDAATTYKWTSANTSCVQVVSSTASTCKVKGLKATTSAVKINYKATIVMSYPPGPISFEAYFKVTVKDNSTKVAEIKLIPESVVIKPLQTEQLSAEVLPDNATNKAVTWSSSEPSVVTVDENGLLTAQTEGNATVFATAADGSGVTGTCQVQVKESQNEMTEADDSVYLNPNLMKLPLCPAEYSDVVYNHVFPTSAITVRLKNGERFCFPRDSADYSKCSIFFDKPTDVEGLYLEGCRDLFVEEMDYVKNIRLSSQKVEIPEGTQTFTTNALGSHSGILSLINDSGQDIELTINGVVYYFQSTYPSTYLSLYYADNCSDPGFTLRSVDPETGLDMIKQIAGEYYSANLSHIISPITTARIHFDNNFLEIGGEAWASIEKQNIYKAEFKDPVPASCFKWKYTTESDEVKFKSIKQNSLSSVLYVNEPVKECAIIYDDNPNNHSVFEKVLNIHSITLVKNPDYLRLKGDVNEDKQVDISDIVAIINIIAGQTKD